MKFTCIDTCRLIDMRKFTSKKGNELTFLKLADVETFENIELLPVKDMDVNKLKLNTDYMLVLHYDGRYASAELKDLL